MATNIMVAVIGGRLTKRPELKQTAGGTVVLPFTIAVNKQKGGDTHTEYCECVAYGKLAENISQYFDKGSEIVITCHSWITRTWQDRDKQTRYKTEYEVRDFCFVGARKSATDQEPTQQAQTTAGRFYAGLTPNSAGAFSAGSPTAPNFEDLGAQDDLPF